MKTIRKLFITLAFLAVSAVSGIALFEATFLLFSEDLPYYRYYYRVDAAAGFDIVENHPPVDFLLSDPPHKVWSNELGCFDDPYRGEEEYILLVGDSFAWGYAPFEEKWGTRLEKLLNSRVLKCGVAGYGTKSETIKAGKVVEAVKAAPKLIVLGYWYGNDLQDDYAFPKDTLLEGYWLTKVRIDEKSGRKVYTEDELREMLENYKKYCLPDNIHHPALQRVKCWLDNHSAVYKKVIKPLVREVVSASDALKDFAFGTGLIIEGHEYTVLAFKDPDRYPWLAKAWDEHLQNLKEMKKLADRHGAKLLVVLIPTREQVYDFLKMPEEDDPERPRRILGGFLEKEGIEYFDLLPGFRASADLKPRKRLNADKDLYGPFDLHWSINGNRLAAELTAGYICDKKMLNTPGAAAVSNKPCMLK